ncbi:hypothetical protein B0O99DRAFT_14557 [Bisporella sp. PMI_857]|nr:hypothetical protein B0O99DRAFT_14557 [Bisporella sp. PMI_857]
MADEAVPLAVALPLAAESAETSSTRSDAAQSEVKGTSNTNGAEAESAGATKEVATEPVAPSSPAPDTKTSESTNDKQDKPVAAQEDVEIKDIKTDEASQVAGENPSIEIATPASADKSKARRKSSGIPEHKTKKLNKKASKAKMTHTDAKPGDYFMIKLKGYPLWPGIVCDETMLPSTLLKSRPVTAARPDGTYRADYEDGGSKVKDRTFPVMYLHTNEFGWVANYDLVDMDVDTVGNVSDKMRKDLQAAHLLAAEQNDLDYFKDILANFMQAKAAEAAEKEAAKAAKQASKEASKSKQRKSISKAVVDEDEDVEMEDAAEDQNSEGDGASAEKPKKTKKRKADEDGAAPQRADSVKKPKTIKINNTPKATNGTATPKPAKDASAKPKTKKAAAKPKEPEPVIPQEPELTPEQKQDKKQKEIMFLRHKLQKGLLGKEGIKEDEIKQMSEFVTKLEGYADLEVSIIRGTKINKVLKAILKLKSIPKEEEFQFKVRSQTLLDKWNKLLDSETPATTTAATNGASEDAKPDGEETKDTPAPAPEVTNGVKDSTKEKKISDAQTAPAVSKDATTEVGSTPTQDTKLAKESIPEPTTVESTA